MDIICFILKQHSAINQEENLKLRIKDCIEKYGDYMEKEFRLLKKSDIMLFTIYKEMNSQHLSHLISFYSFLIIMKIEEESIIKLTLHSLNDFIKYKNELNLSDKILSFCVKEISSFFSFCVYKRISCCSKYLYSRRVNSFYNLSCSICVKIK